MNELLILTGTEKITQEEIVLRKARLLKQSITRLRAFSRANHWKRTDAEAQSRSGTDVEWVGGKVSGR